MSNIAGSIPRRPSDSVQEPLTCRLQIKEHVGRQGLVPLMGELEITNRSPDAIEIEHCMSPLQYLELEVTDAAGRVVSEGHFSDRLSPSLEVLVLRLLPGEMFVATVPLLATLPREQRVAGVYFVRAIYEHPNLRAVSDPVTVELVAGA